VFEPSGRYLVIGGMLGKEKAVPALELWDLESRRIAYLPTGNEDYTQAVRSLSIDRSGAFLAFTTGAETVNLLETQGWKIRQTMDASSAGDAVQRPAGRFLLSVKTIVALAFSKEGNSLIAETDQGEIKHWDLRTGEVKQQLKGEGDPANVAASTNGVTFAELLDGEVTLVNATTGEHNKVALPQQGVASAVALSSEGDLMAIGSGAEVVLLDVTTGTSRKTLRSSGSSIDCLAFSDDGRTLAVANESGMVQFWNLATSTLAKTIATGARSHVLRLAPNGSVLAIADGKTIALYDVRTGTMQRRLEKHDATVNALAFSADGQLLASGGDDRTAIIWEVGSGKSKHTLKGHDQTVRTVAFSPDGRFLASGSGNASVVVWDITSGKLDRVLK